MTVIDWSDVRVLKGECVVVFLALNRFAGILLG